MNIVHVVRQFYPAVGGLESVVYELAAAQVAAGHAVRVITLDRVFKATRDSVLPPREIICGVEVVRIPYVGSTRYPLAPSAIKFVHDADILHVHGIDFFFDYFAWTKLFHRKRLVVSTHGGFFHTSYQARLKRIYFHIITRMSLFWYDAVAAVSFSDAELFDTICRRRTVCIENGVDVSKYFDASCTAPRKAILTLGRLASNKRLDHLISFIAALRLRDSQWRLTIAGRPWDIDVADLLRLAESHHVRDAVEVVVVPTQDEIRGLMERCSVIASASEYEGFGLSAVEGMSAGLFPLLSDIPTYCRLVAHAGTGMIVDFSNAAAAADKFVTEWRAVEIDYPRHRKGSMDAASVYDWSRVSQTYAELYQHVCGAKTRNILGVSLSVGTAPETVELLDARFASGKSTIVAFANAHSLNIASSDMRFRTVLQNAVVINDGVGVDIASRILFGSPFPQNLNGTDFTPRYLQNTQYRYRIFLLGSRPSVAEQAREYFARSFPQHCVVGWHHGYFSKDDTRNVVNMIKSSNADIVLVGMGNPKQELWLAEHLEATGCRLGLGVGALFDFVTGEVHRAPGWLRLARLEWFHRLILEPRRLWRRYLIGNFAFIFRVLSQRLSRSEGPPHLMGKS